MYGEPVLIASVSEVVHLVIEKFIGNLNLFFIRETTSIKEVIDHYHDDIHSIYRFHTFM